MKANNEFYYYNSWYHRNYTNFSEFNDNNATLNKLNTLAMVNTIVRPLLSVSTTVGINKTNYYATFISDGVSFDYPPWYIHKKINI